jgi:hypothetical protein
MLILYLLNKGTSMHCTGVVSVWVVAVSLHHPALRHKAGLAHLGSLQQKSSKRSNQSCTELLQIYTNLFSQCSLKLTVLVKRATASSVWRLPVLQTSGRCPGRIRILGALLADAKRQQ